MFVNSVLSLNTIQTLLDYYSSWIALDIIHFTHQYNQHKLIHHLIIHMTMLNEESRQLTSSGPLLKVRCWVNVPPQHKSNILLMVSKSLGLCQFFVMIYTTIWSIYRIWNIRVSWWWLLWNTVGRQLSKCKLHSADDMHSYMKKLMNITQ